MRRIIMSFAVTAALIATAGVADAQKRKTVPFVVTNPDEPPRDPSSPPPPPPPETIPPLPPASPV